MKGLYDLNDKFRKVKPENCLISEITLAELKFGVENSQNKERNQKALDNFLFEIVIIPIFQAIYNYARKS